MDTSTAAVFFVIVSLLIANLIWTTSSQKVNCNCKECPDSPALLRNVLGQIIESTDVPNNIQTIANEIETKLEEMENAIGGDNYSQYTDLQSLPSTFTSDSNDDDDCVVDCIETSLEMCAGSILGGPEALFFCYAVADLGIDVACMTIKCLL